ncbi:HD domain-containing phosphohydrolase [Fusibacter sp. JL298sf-3]
MIKNYRKISIVAYLNILIIVILELLHGRLMEISDSLLFFVLMVYAVLNGWYVQRVLLKQKRYEVDLAAERNFSNNILETTMTGIVVISDEIESIEYINEAARSIFALDKDQKVILKKVFGENYDSIKKLLSTQKEGKIQRKLSLELQGKDFIKHLDIECVDFKHSNSERKFMLSIEDVTESYELNDRIEKQYLNMFRSFVKFIDAKDTYTGLHSSSVTDYVQRILEQLEISDEEKQDIIVAANLHDIGKIGVPEYILNKPGKLTDEEFLLMKDHSTIGESLLNEIEGYEHISNFIRHHHEKYNGTGYPDGLKGEEIPLGSRIIAVADAFDAITTDRVYQRKRTVEEALSIMTAVSGKQFDPFLVKVFIESIIQDNALEAG